MLRTKAWDRKDSINMGSYIFHLLLLIKVAVLAHFIDKKAEAGGNEVTLTCTSGGGGGGHGQDQRLWVGLLRFRPWL